MTQNQNRMDTKELKSCFEMLLANTLHDVLNTYLFYAVHQERLFGTEE